MDIKIIKHFLPFQGLPKYFQIGTFGIKIYHLATLVLGRKRMKFWSENSQSPIDIYISDVIIGDENPLDAF
jgi:hypothetical protein